MEKPPRVYVKFHTDGRYKGLFEYYLRQGNEVINFFLDSESREALLKCDQMAFLAYETQEAPDDRLKVIA
jgi:hypothetical protein